MSSCQDLIDAEYRKFSSAAFASVMLTLICSVVRRSKWETYNQNPREGYMTMFGFAVIKIILGVLLATVFQVTCPGGCECTGQVHDYLYPGIVFAVSLYWIFLGKKFYDMSRSGEQAPSTEITTATGVV